jgi:hypothetical protein
VVAGTPASPWGSAADPTARNGTASGVNPPPLHSADPQHAAVVQSLLAPWLSDTMLAASRFTAPPSPGNIFADFNRRRSDRLYEPSPVHCDRTAITGDLSAMSASFSPKQ